jgi:hypothetical protein
MAGMDPEAGFMPEAKKLFKDEKVVYIKVAKGGQPICRWLEEWQEIAKKNGLDKNHIKRIHKGGEVEFYQPILDQYKGMLKKHPKFESVTFCWMQGERDASGGADAAYKDALKLLISKLRRDLDRPDMNVVIGRLSDAGQKNRVGRQCERSKWKLSMKIIVVPGSMWMISMIEKRMGRLSTQFITTDRRVTTFSGSVLLARAMHLSKEKSPLKTADRSPSCNTKSSS